MNALVSPYVDTSPKEEPSGVHAKPVARPSLISVALAAPPAVTAKVLTVVAWRFAVTFEELKGRDRHRRIAHARHIAAWLLRAQGLSLCEVGAALCRDHTTISNSLSVVERAIQAEPETRSALEQLSAAVQESAKGVASGEQT